LESVPRTQVRRGEPASWGKIGDWLPSASNGIVGKLGFGQSAFCWHTRLLPKVKQAFSAIWGDNDLLVSFDGGNVFRPWRQRPDNSEIARATRSWGVASPAIGPRRPSDHRVASPEEWRTEGSWWHVDQNAFLPGMRGRMSVQGLVTFTDATPATGGLCVVPGSHLQHEEVSERACGEKLPANFLPVQGGDPVLGAGGRLVCARAGDLLLWDSRCVHCNTPGSIEEDEDEEQQQTCLPKGDQGGGGGELPEEEGSGGIATAATAELLRVAAYVCMTPAAWASEDVRKWRKDHFLRNVTTGHLPHVLTGAGEAPEWPPPRSWDTVSPAQRLLIVGASPSLS